MSVPLLFAVLMTGPGMAEAAYPTGKNRDRQLSITGGPT